MKFGIQQKLLFAVTCVLFCFVFDSARAANLPENEYELPEGFRSLKWETHLTDAKKIYPDLLFVEQIPRKDPKYLYYRRKNENKVISGLNWDQIKYGFTKNKDFCSMDADTRLELENRAKAVEQYNDLYQKIVAKYGKAFHSEKTDKQGFPFVYYAIWHIKSESVSLELKAIQGHHITTNKGTDRYISMLELTLSLYSKKAESKALGF